MDTALLLGLLMKAALLLIPTLMMRLVTKGSTKNCYRYCGEQFDETTGLYYLRARYMDTSTGRFISQDT